jgi:hypothetical protein
MSRTQERNLSITMPVSVVVRLGVLFTLSLRLAQVALTLRGVQAGCKPTRLQAGESIQRLRKHEEIPSENGQLHVKAV